MSTIKKDSPFLNLILHPNTRQQLELIAKKPGQGYLFVGQSGSGKYSAAVELAALWSGGDRGLVSLVAPTGTSIGIEEILKLKSVTKHKLANNQLRQTIIIDNAEVLTREAQNALLKSLEEPVSGVSYILIAQKPQDLLATVVSRLVALTFYIVQKSDLATLVSDSTAFEKYYHIGRGTPGGILAAVNSADDLTFLDEAKLFLQAARLERAITVAQLQKKDRGDQKSFLESLSMLLALLLRQSAAANDTTSAKQHASRLKAISEILQGYDNQINARLSLTRLVLEL